MKFFSRKKKPDSQPQLTEPTPAGQRRAFMIIYGAKHTVINAVTREKYELEPPAAWQKFNEINGIKN